MANDAAVSIAQLAPWAMLGVICDLVSKHFKMLLIVLSYLVHCIAYTDKPATCPSRLQCLFQWDMAATDTLLVDLVEIHTLCHPHGEIRLNKLVNVPLVIMPDWMCSASNGQIPMHSFILTDSHDKTEPVAVGAVGDASG